MIRRYSIAATAAGALFALLIAAIALPGATFSRQISLSFVYPIMAPRVSSGFGMRVHPIRRFSLKHTGIDLAAPQGAVIRAVAAGTVVYADKYAGYGNLISIKHSDNLTTMYGHCFAFRVHPGQHVNAGQIIGEVGSTGMSTGPHLHFEVRVDGDAKDPEKIFPGLAIAAAG
jgi:murein DD-endopeptidase MepM/ murein hydrolase activator NlpD